MYAHLLKSSYVFLQPLGTIINKSVPAFIKNLKLITQTLLTGPRFIFAIFVTTL